MKAATSASGSAPNCVAVMPASCVVDREAISVAVRALIAVVDRARICDDASDWIVAGARSAICVSERPVMPSVEIALNRVAASDVS